MNLESCVLVWTMYTLVVTHIPSIRAVRSLGSHRDGDVAVVQRTRAVQVAILADGHHIALTRCEHAIGIAHVRVGLVGACVVNLVVLIRPCGGIHLIRLVKIQEVVCVMVEVVLLVSRRK